MYIYKPKSKVEKECLPPFYTRMRLFSASFLLVSSRPGLSTVIEKLQKEIEDDKTAAPPEPCATYENPGKIDGGSSCPQSSFIDG